MTVAHVPLDHSTSFPRYPFSVLRPLSREANHIDDGYSITLTLAPKLFGGRLCRKLARTRPELPCGRVTFPQMTRIFDP